MFFNFKVCLTTCFCTLKEMKVGYHGTKKTVTDSFPWSLGTEMKNLLSMGFEILGCCVTTKKDQDTQTSQKQTN